MPDVIVPRKCVAELRKLVDEADGDVEISLSSSKIRFSLGGAVLTSKLIDGTFPDYSRVIPTANDRLLRIDSKRDRKSVVSGKSVSVRVDLGGRRIIKKKNSNDEQRTIKKNKSK